MDMNALMNDKITKAVEKALAGSRKVKITFKREAAGEVSYLLGMLNSGIVSLNNSDDQMTLLAVNQSRNWHSDRDRTVALTLTEKFDQEWFTSRMYRALEKIEFVNTK